MILVTAKISGELFAQLKQPPIIGEMIFLLTAIVFAMVGKGFGAFTGGVLRT